MAVEPTQITQTLPSPQLTGITTAYTEKLAPLIGQALPTSSYTGTQFVAPESQLQQDARALAPGLGGYQQYLTAAEKATGPDAYKSYLSPYQTDVIQATQDLLNRQRQQGLGALSAQAIGSGAFGGAREGIARGEYEASRDIQDAQILAQLRQQGFTQAQQAAATAQAQQAGLASLQPSLAQSQIQQLGAAGTSNLAYQQAILDAASQAAQTAAYEPYQRMQFLGSAIGGMLSGQPQAYSTVTSAPAAGTVSPLSQALSGAATIYGLGSLFGR